VFLHRLKNGSRGGVRFVLRISQYYIDEFRAASDNLRVILLSNGPFTDGIRKKIARKYVESAVSKLKTK
jgi:hypothetical protein